MEVLKVTGKIDGLVNAHQNKSHLVFEQFEHVSEENWDKVVEVNLERNIFNLPNYWFSNVTNGGGSIVNLPSTYSVVAPNQNLYKELI